MIDRRSVYIYCCEFALIVGGEIIENELHLHVTYVGFDSGKINLSWI